MKITIITVAYNSEKTIEKTIESITGQTFQDIEYIIIDGKSQDKTIEIAETYKNKIAKIISEPDAGIYDAMNKGISESSGDYLMFLNSDDQLYDNNVIETAVKSIEQDPKDIIWGNLCNFDSKTNIKTIKKLDKFNKIYLIKNTPAQPCTFYKKSVFKKVGYFSTDYSIVSDQEWFLKAFLVHKLSYLYLNLPITVFNTGGVSTNQDFEKKHTEERQRMFLTYFSIYEFKLYSYIAKYFRSLTNIPIFRFLFEI